MIHRRACLAIMLVACAGARPATSAAQGTRAPRVTSVFGAHGGVGMWPSGQVPPYFGVAVVDIDLPTAASSALGVREFELLDAAGHSEAALAAVERIDQLPLGPPSPQFATYLNPTGVPLSGPLPAGTTRVRIRVRMNHGPRAYATQFRLTLTGLGAPVTITGTMNGSWPT